MRKIFLIMSLALVVLLSSCENGLISDTETVDFRLPEWSQTDDSGIEYPELSRWKISVCSADGENVFYLGAGERYVSVNASKNVPVCITALPVTRLADGTETCFFKPSGAIYPYNTAFTWEGGFTAHIMQRIIRSKKETGISSENLKTFLMEFNWKKMNETVQKRLLESFCDFENQEAENPKFYNPWLIDSFSLLDNLTFAIFDSKYLNTTYVFSVGRELVRIPEDKTLLSSFLPENQIIKKYGVMAVKKKVAQTFLIDNTYAATLTATSAKKVSADFTYMPILIEDYENSE